MRVIEGEVKSGGYWLMGEYELKKYMSRHQAQNHRTDLEGFIPLDSPRVEALFQLSADARIPVQIHLEPDDALLDSLESALERHPDASVIWCHLGNRKYPDKQERYSPDYVDRLLTKHRGLSFDLAVTDHGAVYPVNGVVVNTLQRPDGKLRRKWRDVIERHPSRFVIGSDMGPENWARYGMNIMAKRAILAALSAATAEKIAYQNAWRMITGGEWADDEEER